MHWILMIFMSGSSSAVDSTTQEFNTKDACVFAAKVVNEDISKRLPGYIGITPVCVPKG